MMELLAIGLACVALALASAAIALLADDWLAEREVRRAREAHLARKRLARGG